MAARGAVENDLSSIVSTLGQHDVHIQGLNRRMTGVEQEVQATRVDLNKGFTDMGAKLTALETSKAPPIGQMVKMTVGVATLVSLVGGAITFLVISIMAPETARITKDLESQSRVVTKYDTERDAELARLRQEKEDRLESRLTGIEAQLGWLPKEIRRAAK